MKSLIFGMALCAASLPALAQNVSISVGQPGFYGRVDVGNFAPAPVLYAPRPVIVAPAPGYAAPIYLRVPPAHRMHWARWCGYYRACGLPVLFVRDDWYMRSYVPAYREHFGYRGRVVEYRGGPRHEGREVERAEFRGDHGRHEGWDRGHGGEGHGEGHGEHHGRD